LSFFIVHMLGSSKVVNSFNFSRLPFYLNKVQEIQILS